MDDKPYLTTQLIAYIGNKRSLLPFLRDTFLDLDASRRITRFGDLFAGSGAVSRLGKSLGYSVVSNDWERYSFILNSCHIELDREETGEMFPEFGGPEGAVEYLQNLPRISHGYVASHYAPESTEAADYRKERLFYTRENGEFIDTVREEIEKLYPGWDHNRRKVKEKQLLLASLLYQAATHANTSGVFKAFHKGFGGHGADALSRIVRPMRLQLPVLINGREKCRASCRDAAEAVRGESMDLCYLDPPYNQHQYGSNYHLLNTIALWDKPEQPLERTDTGRLKNKGGIRRDWTKTRSDFCYKETALSAFSGLLDKIDSRYIALSYNTEGIMPYEEIIDLLDRRGRINLYSSEYIIYRGGRQSNSRKMYNVEYLIVCSAGEYRSRQGREDALRFFKENRIRTLMRGAFYPEKIRQCFPSGGGAIDLDPASRNLIRLPMEGYIYFRQIPMSEDLRKFSVDELDDIYRRLSDSLIEEKHRECALLLQILKEDGRDRPINRKIYEDWFVRALKKIAHRKYKKEYSDIIRQIPEGTLEYRGPELDRIRNIAEKRFAG